MLEQVLDADPGGKYPYVLGGKRTCPPDDYGGWYLPTAADAPRSKTALPRQTKLKLGAPRRRR